MVSSVLDDIAVPARIERLTELAYNLWWSWHNSARDLFRSIDPFFWEVCNQNPVLFLSKVDPAKLEAAAANHAFQRRYDAIIHEFEGVEAEQDTWVSNNEPTLLDNTLAYFSAEFGVHPALPIYSGGLGVLAGDHVKEMSDLGLPAVAVSLLYRQGYLRQYLDDTGWQQDVPSPLEPGVEPTRQVLKPDGSPCMVDIPFDGDQSPLRLAIWRVQVGRVPIFLLDADVEGNPDWTRTISSRLYGGDREHRLRQELILGIGGVRALRAMDVNPSYWHANEGHAAFHLLERVREYVAGGLTFDQAAEKVRATTVFTTHTPVPAGHDVFSRELIDRYFGNYWPQLGLDRDQFYALGHSEESGDGFNLTALSLRLAQGRNGVSKIHGDISREMWHGVFGTNNLDEVPIRSITNGVHLTTWIHHRMEALYDRYLPSNWRATQNEPETWEEALSIPNDAWWRVHQTCKQDLIDTIAERTRRRWIGGQFNPVQVVTAGPFLDRRVLTIGFARRFATYKRATLLFRDLDRLAKILNDPERPVQIVFAGKAHPADDGGKRLIQEIFKHASDARFGGRITFAEDYDMSLASALVAGVDVWINNPRAPMEASGTSGMKAAVNGVPNLSILDGWWPEAWLPDNSNGWGIEAATDGTEDERDAADANALYETLENLVVPLYYRRNPDGVPAAWAEMAKKAIRTVAPQFCAKRMVVEYIRNLYRPAADSA